MIQLIPLGGLREIGSNMMLVQDDQCGLIIDAGILFPDQDVFDLNYLIPNYRDYDLSCFKAIFLTHGHEDHIGGLNHILEAAPHLEVYAPELTKMMLERKNLSQLRGKSIKIISADKKVSLGDFSISFFQVPHSLPQTMNLHISWKNELSLTHITDGRINENQMEPAFPFEQINKLNEGFKRRIGLIDSTNIQSDQIVASEDALLPNLEKLIAAPGRIILTLFPSNLYRFFQIMKSAHQNGRKIALIGRSMERAYDLLTDVKQFKECLEFKVSNGKDLDDMDNHVLYLVSGCQGDFKSAMRRIANGTDAVLKVRSGDRVIFSSRTIPGNENSVNLLYNLLSEKGAEIITPQDEFIHVSGHPSKIEIKRMIEEFNFTDIIPVHGESHHIAQFNKLCKIEFPQIKIHPLLNHDRLQLDQTKTKLLIHESPPHPLYISGNGHEIEKSAVSERRKIAQSGLVAIAYDAKRKKSKIEIKGLPQFIKEETDHLASLIKQLYHVNLKNDHSESIRIGVRNYLNERLGYKPITLVMLF